MQPPRPFRHTGARRSPVLIACVVLAIVTGVTGKSDAAPRRASDQLSLVAAADHIADLGRLLKATFGGVRLDVERHTVELWIKGTPSAAVRREIRRQQDRGIRISTHRAKYSEEELLQAARRVMAQPEKYPGVHRIGPRPDSSGLDAGSHASPGVSAAALSFPVPTTVTGEPAIVAKSRSDDSPPYWAGAVIRPVGRNDRCSSGFAASRVIFGPRIQTGILAPEHCAIDGGVPFVDGGGDMVGVADPAAYRHSDSLFIPTSAGARTFDGGVGQGEFSKPVIGSVGNLPGQLVCTSGAATGAHCGIRISLIKQLVRLEPSFLLVEEVVLAEQESGLPAVGNGDSGGPVFTLNSDSTRVYGAGMIIGGDDAFATECPRPEATGCTSRVAYVELRRVLGIHGLNLMTS